jgi:hypothetical protein
MARSYPVAEGALDEMQAALRRARTADELRRAQCVRMRLGMGMKALEIAKAWAGGVVGSRRAVAVPAKGAGVFEGPGRGGRRYEVVTRDAEVDLLNRLRAEAWPNAVLKFRDIHQTVERAPAGRLCLPQPNGCLRVMAGAPVDGANSPEGRPVGRALRCAAEFGRLVPSGTHAPGARPLINELGQ